jgi:hypothetical protein
MIAAEFWDSKTSTASAPPLLLDVTPVAPHATSTELLSKVVLLMLKFDKATLSRYTEPPPPSAEPGRTEEDTAWAEHRKKLLPEMITSKFDPDVFALCRGENIPFSIRDDCGE